MSIKSRKARERRRRRVRMKLSGTPERPRLNVFRSLEHIYAQVIDDVEGRTLASASSLDKDLRSEMSDKTKKEQAELVGKTVAERAKAAGVETVVFDRGGFLYHGRIKALADGAREGGLKF
ncbi:MAG: 50S ribosomal protein L18 [Anaerolineae bacterium]|nr:50S ribosomal protein L18 [Anaerolineae bacterium]